MAVAAYLIGSVNSSILISRMVSGRDIRKSGSGNAGATNMLRTMGKKYAVITLIIDILKGVIAVLIAKRWGSAFIPQMPYIAGVFVVLGHNFPVFFGFKGGKGVATSLGVLLMLDWKIGLIVLAFALAVMAVTRYVSLGSILAAVLFAIIEMVIMSIYDEFDIIKTVCVIVLAGLLVARHHANIGRLFSGTENKLGSGKKRS
ncbi:MAG: glycerol-3-phosphate 1-O-acyltransferase PlsY [Oscillospiraceae bacterium]|nr:glycerol-3-phosphate 1-O-acyltransferase PlsY [Oscillospiraceae bacterium]